MYLIDEMFTLLKKKRFTTLIFDFHSDILELKIDNSYSIKEEMTKLVKHLYLSYMIKENLSFLKKETFYGFYAKGICSPFFKLWYKQNFNLKMTFTHNEILNYQIIKEIDFYKKIKNHSNEIITKDNHLLFIGQFNKEFLLLKMKNKLIIIDQHALHERINLNGLLRANKLSLYDEIEPLKQCACKKAIKFGQIIKVKFAKKLINLIQSEKYITACAHGRITMCVIDKIN